MYISTKSACQFAIGFAAFLGVNLFAIGASGGGVAPAVPTTPFTEVKKLIASDRDAGDRFGESVAVDRDTVVVGAYFDDSRRGAAYVFQRNKNGSESWGEIRKLRASDGAADDRMGTSVGISGDTIVVGAPGESTRGAAYVFDRNAGGADNWGEVKKLTASTSMFGASVAISDDTIVVGASSDNVARGAVFIFERNRGGANNWGEVKKVTASDGENGDVFGDASAISGDTIVVGARADDALGRTDNGSAYIFERNKGGFDNWGEVKKLTATDGANGHQFGYRVTISSSTVAISTGDESNRGAVFVYERNKGGPDNWGEVRKLIGTDSAAGNLFGSGVGISGDTLVAGAQSHNGSRGAAYVYQRNNRGADNWGELKKLTASDAAGGDVLGSAVAISSDTVIAAAEGDDFARGSAYVFAGHDSLWIQQRKTTASDGAASDLLGVAKVSGDTAVVGALGNSLNRGAAYIFERNKGGAENWGEVKRLVASDGEAGELFGNSVAIYGDTIVVGARRDDASRGAVYVFERNKGGPDNWGEVRKLTAADGTANDQFGMSVAISVDQIVVGAWRDDEGRGSAYIFDRNSGGADNWGQVKRITASDGLANDDFGYSVGISGGTVVIGAIADDAFKGSAYIYERNRGGVNDWGEVRKLTDAFGVASDQYGCQVAIDGSAVVVGALNDDSGRGSAFVYERNKGGADNWGEVKKLSPSDGGTSDRFGWSVGINGDRVLVGSPRSLSNRGSAYIFERNKGGADNWGEVSKVLARDGVASDLFGEQVAIGADWVVVSSIGDDSSKGSAYFFRAYPEAVSVSAASFQRLALAPEMIAAAFGVDLATGIELAGTIPLPTNLRGTTVTVTDSVGIERSAGLFFVSSDQVNYFIPAGTALGPATVKITSGSGQISFGIVEIAAVSPGFFTANSTGQGIAASLALRVRGGVQTYETLSQFDAGTSSFVPIPLDLGPPGDQVFLVMYGTGFRFRTSESGVIARVGGRTLQSLFSGAIPDFIGLDQLNISPLPRDLIGAGVVNIEITVDGKPANVSTVTIK